MRCTAVGLLTACCIAACAAAGTSAATGYAPVVAGKPLSFPQDFGSHPEFRTEWWYVTGWLHTAERDPLGFQITFFRTRPPPPGQANPSAFSPEQILIAHCAISDPKRGRLWQDQKIRRSGFGLVDAKVGDTQVWIERWRLQHDGGDYAATIEAADFSLGLRLHEVQPPLLNGDRGFSRKGPEPSAASYYYSIPHLRVSGTISRN